MRLHFRLITLLSGIMAITFTGCGGSQGVRITEGNQAPEAAAPTMARYTPIIVHIDLFERTATVRNGLALGNEFLITTDYAGAETSVLKTRPSNVSETLLTADILEGDPKINNRVKSAGPARSIELSKLFSNTAE